MEGFTGGVPLDLSSRSSGGDRISPNGKDKEDTVMEAAPSPRGRVDAAGGYSHSEGNGGGLAFPASIDESGIFAPPSLPRN